MSGMAPPAAAQLKKKPPPSSSQQHPQHQGMDLLLTVQGKSLQRGQKRVFRLIKGKNTVERSADPIDAAAPPTDFPLLAKFPESVVKPTFEKHPWNHARLYQQDVPKPAEDSEDEEAEDAQQQPKKRWKFRSSKEQGPARQWILQEDVDFLQTMVARREKRKIDPNQISSRYEGTPEFNPSHYALFTTSTSTSSAAQQKSTDDDNEDEDHDSSTSNMPTIYVSMLPKQNATINFAQPAARRTLSLNKAEQALQDLRAGMITNLRPPPGSDNDVNGANGMSASGGATNGDKDDEDASDKDKAAMQRRVPPRNGPLGLFGKKNTTKSRLMDKLKKVASKNADPNEDEGDDIMADVTYKQRKGGGGAARKELLTTLGDGVTVSDDGVLGGTNDAAFGGRQRFGQLAIPNEKSAAADSGEGAEGAEDAMLGDAGGSKPADRGNDGLAMADDFYQRDVGAEYEELDYDANEQFDDDDVDVGAAEQQEIDADGFAARDQDEDDDEEDEMELQDDTASGVEGLATAAGFKALLAKARGETTAAAATEGDGTDNPQTVAGAAGQDGGASAASANGNGSANNSMSAHDKKQKKRSQVDENDTFSKFMATVEKGEQKARFKQERSGAEGGNNNGAAEAARAPAEAAAANAAAAASAAADSAKLVDKDGLRIISLELVREEIWLNHGSIPMKRLMKLFDVKKKYGAQRQNDFRNVVRELCTMKSDPVSGNMLVLKQHYSHKG